MRFLLGAVGDGGFRSLPDRISEIRQRSSFSLRVTYKIAFRHVPESKKVAAPFPKSITSDLPSCLTRKMFYYISSSILPLLMDFAVCG